MKLEVHVEKMDTTTTAILQRCKDAAKFTSASFHAGETMRMASGIFALETLGIKDETIITEFLLVWLATPGWFACGNNSACRQADERKTPTEDTSVKNMIAAMLKK